MFAEVDYLIFLSKDYAGVSPDKHGFAPKKVGQGRNDKLKSMVAASLAKGELLHKCISALIKFDATHHSPPLFSDESEPDMKGGDIQMNALRLTSSVAKSINQKRLAEGLPVQVFGLGEVEEENAAPLVLADFCASKYEGDPPPIIWLVEKVFRRGAAYLLAGMGGIGKGFLTLDLAIKVTLLSWKVPPDACGGAVVSKGKTVIISCEDDSEVFHRRIADLDKNGLRHKYPGKLMVLPLPNAGGTKPFVVQSKNGFEITPFYADFRRQLIEMEDLRLVVLDTLQGLFQCDFNADPAAGQFCAGVLQELATKTGSCVIACHHMKKPSKEISSPSDAREAIRGTTAIVDGLRGAYAMWLTPTKRAKEATSELGLDWRRNLVVNGAIVKSNSEESMHISTFVRNECGLLEDMTNELKGHDMSDVCNQLLGIFLEATDAGKPFFKSGKKGVYERRHELPLELQSWGRDKLANLIQEMADDGVIAIDSKTGISVVTSIAV